ncbi:MAG: M42 family metallopeptidase [Desulfitobacterium hafniense]|nr:M42 family metallopeptidase [Desulfitobacterium hafniense]
MAQTSSLDFMLLKRLTQTFGPSGSEDTIRSVIIQEIQSYCDEISTDVMGNLIARRQGKGKNIMIAAHMDEIGIMVTHIDEKGFLRFTPIGGVRVNELPHRKVQFKNATIGVIGMEKLDKLADLKLERLFIDIAANSKEDAESRIRVGDTAVFVGEFHDQGDKIISKALDDRIGCFIAIEALKRVKSTFPLSFVFTVQEEVGLRGAQTSAYALEPDLAIAVDVTLTGDTPKAHRMDVKLGSGAAIKVLDRSIITPPQIKRWMIKTAEEKEIKYQLEVLESGGTDSGAIHLTKSGVPAGVISIPTRYVHSTAEMADKHDIEAAVNLLVALLESYELPSRVEENN